MEYILVTHEQAHFDELVAIWLLRKFGEAKYPGVAKASVIFRRPTDNPPATGKINILIGVGGGIYDEHATAGQVRKSGCAATLMADGLGIGRDPALAKILAYTKARDTGAIKDQFGEFEIAPMTKLFYVAGKTEQEVMEIVFTFLDAKYEEQRKFHHETAEEYQQTATIEEIGPIGQTLKIATIISDNQQMSAFARSRSGGQASIIIQQSSTGHVRIFTNHNDPVIRARQIKLDDLARLLRMEEQKLAGWTGIVEWEELEAGDMVGDRWYYHGQGQMLLNGSTTATNVPPTRLSLARVKELARLALDWTRFESPDCKKLCTASRKDPCPWYGLGLIRCRQLRRQRSGA